MILSPGIHAMVANNAPAFPVAGYRAWYDASQITGYADNDPLDTWLDISANALHLTSAGAFRPTYRTNALNGRAGMEFGGGQQMANAGIIFPTGYQHTVFFVLTIGTPLVLPNSCFVLDMNNGGAFSRRSVQTFDNAGATRTAYARDNGGGATNLAITVGESLVYAAKEDGGSSLLRLNGSTGRESAFVVSTDTTASAGPFYVGRSSLIAGDYFNGKIMEFLAYDSALGATDFALNESYLRNKYGLP